MFKALLVMRPSVLPVLFKMLPPDTLRVTALSVAVMPLRVEPSAAIKLLTPTLPESLVRLMSPEVEVAANSVPFNSLSHWLPPD